ncbi:MAG: DUF3099 domain-containing protein [Candidatus Nanopelagicales bacterium]
MPPVYRITTAGHEPTPEQRDRERTYLIMMAIRFVAVILAVVLPGMWRVAPVVLGVFLPYVAVVLVNAVRTKDRSAPGQDVALRPRVAAPMQRPSPEDARSRLPIPPKDG